MPYTPLATDHARQRRLALELLRDHATLAERVGELERGPHGAKLRTRLEANMAALKRTIDFSELVMTREGTSWERSDRLAGFGPVEHWGGEARGDAS